MRSVKQHKNRHFLPILISAVTFIAIFIYISFFKNQSLLSIKQFSQLDPHRYYGVIKNNGEKSIRPQITIQIRSLANKEPKQFTFDVEPIPPDSTKEFDLMIDNKWTDGIVNIVQLELKDSHHIFDKAHITFTPWNLPLSSHNSMMGLFPYALGAGLLLLSALFA